MTYRLLALTNRVLARAGLLRIFVYLTGRWVVKRRRNDRLIFPFVQRRRLFQFHILLYHRVNDDQDPFFSAVPIKVFRQQVEMLRRYFHVLPLEELVERLKTTDIPANSVAITFDDGYRDNYENAFPILRQFGLPATIFLTTGPLQSRTLLWHDKVFDAFRQTRVTSVVIHGKTYPLSTLADKRVALQGFLRDLRTRTPRDRDALIRRLTGALQVSDECSTRWQKLSWSEIEEMSKHKISFGAHTVTHALLTRMPLAEAVDEVLASKAAIETNLKRPIRLFAYPNGSREDFNESVKQAVKDAGFLGAVTTIWGANGVHADPFELRRISIWDFDPRVSALRLGWYRFLSETY